MDPPQDSPWTSSRRGLTLPAQFPSCILDTYGVYKDLRPLFLIQFHFFRIFNETRVVHGKFGKFGRECSESSEGKVWKVTVKFISWREKFKALTRESFKPIEFEVFS